MMMKRMMTAVALATGMVFGVWAGSPSMVVVGDELVKLPDLDRDYHYFTVKITGVVVDGEGAGVAKLAKSAVMWSVIVE